MPEIWLPYGDVEVSFDVKAENLGDVIEAGYPEMDETKVEESLGQLDTSGEVLAIICDYDEALQGAARRLLTSLKSKGEVVVACQSGNMAALRHVCEETNCRLVSLGKASEPLGTFEGAEILVPKVITSHAKKVVFSKVGYDPLFGFGGGPVSLMKAVYPQLLGEAFRRRAGDDPLPGFDLPTARFAGQVASTLGELPSVEAVADRKLAGLFVGKVEKVHEEAIMLLASSGNKVVKEPSKGLVVSPGGRNADSSLSSSLHSIWNVRRTAKEGASVVLVAECGGGLGSEALESYAAGRLDLQGMLRRGEYVEGLEDLIYLKELAEEVELIAISTLPVYYLESRLGFKAMKKASEALKYVLTSHGYRVKVHFILSGDAMVITESPRQE